MVWRLCAAACPAGDVVILYHYTCRHSAQRIDVEGVLRPWPQIQLGLYPPPRLVWLTDLSTPDTEALGLTAYTLHCDRTERRYVVDVPAIPWLDWSALHTAGGLDLPGDPSLWWVWPGRAPIVVGGL